MNNYISEVHVYLKRFPHFGIFFRFYSANMPSWFPAAKSALSLPITNMKLPMYDLISRVSKFCFEEWQDIWNCCSGIKLHAIYRVLGTALFRSH